MESDLSDTNSIDVVDERVEVESTKSILDLNVHCLLQVFGHLNVYDAINFGQTCKFLQTMSRMAMTKYKDFVLLDYLKHEFTPQMRMPLRKVLSYVSPHIQLLDARTAQFEDNMCVRDPALMRGITAPLHTFLQFDMPKLQSLVVENSEHLACIITRQTVTKLTIHKLNPNDLYYYVSGMRNLTLFHLLHIPRSVAMDEISIVLENNPNIEDLCLTIEFRNVNTPTEFPADLIRKLPHLKQLELPIGNNLEILESILQIKQLIKLALVCRNPFLGGERLDVFLKKLTEKNTVRTLELKGVILDIGFRVFHTMASMNLTSLLLQPEQSWNFFADLTRANFHTLKNLTIYNVASIDDIIKIIQLFKSLDQLAITFLRDFSHNRLAQKIYQSLIATPTNRPDMELKMINHRASVKISFRRGTFEHIPWPDIIPTLTRSEWIFF